MSKSNLLQKLAITGAATAISAIGFGIADSSAQAAVITSGCADVNQSCTVQELLDGGTIQVDDELFSGWDEITNVKGAGTVDPNNISVGGIFQGTSAPGIGFLSNNNELEVSNGDQLTFEFDFLVTKLDPNKKIFDNELELVDWILLTTGPIQNGLVQVGEKIGTNKGGDDLGIKVVFDEINPNQRKLKDRQVFPPQQSVWVRKKIDIITNPGIIGGIVVFEQRFSQTTPEPGTVLGLLAIGGMGLGLKRKRQS